MYFGGDVYSSADPFATALGTSDSRVSFIGSDEAALALDPGAIDLGGDFLTPGFVHSGQVLGAAAPTAAEFWDRGFSHVHVLGPRESVREFAAAAPAGLEVIAYPEATPEGIASTGDAAAGAAHREGLDGTAVRGVSLSAEAFLDLEAAPTRAVYVRVASAGQLQTVLDRLGGIRAVAQRHGYRLLLDFSVPTAAVEALGSCGLAVTLDPDRPQPLAQLLSAGAQVSWTYSQASPWASVRSAVLGDDGISARAAFNAATRFAHRAAGNPEGGVLVPGAPADIVRWKVERLVVQVSDPRVAAWSTDPRSGTPGLPELSDSVPLPTRVDLD